MLKQPFSPLTPSKLNIPLPLTGLLVLITLLLGLRFYLMLYFPGTTQTLALFKMVSPHWEWLSQVVAILKCPLSVLSQILFPHVPAKAGFPEIPMATFMAWMTHQPADTFKATYPGRIEWLTLMAIPFWNGLLATSYLAVQYLRGSDSLPLAWRQSREMVSDYIEKAKQAQPKPSTTQRSQYTETKTETAPPPTFAPQSTGDAVKTQARLSQTRNLHLNMPDIPKRATLQDWEQYKHQEGELITKDMLRQLQRENSNLQAQQQQLKSTFSQYFSPQVLQYLESNKGTFQNVENERHTITVLFCDIRGFSAYSQTASPDELVKFLSEYFNIASYYILHKYNGIVSKLMGDGLMAYWGFPVPNPDHAFIATSAALDIMKEVAFRNHTNPDAPPLQIGIGIATGEAIVGNIGSSDFKDFTLIGPPVNMAARLEEANKQLNTSLLISDTTYVGLKGRLPCRDMGKVPIRGWQSPEQVYAPIIELPARD